MIQQEQIDSNTIKPGEVLRSGSIKLKIFKSAINYQHAVNANYLYLFSRKNKTPGIFNINLDLTSDNKTVEVKLYAVSDVTELLNSLTERALTNELVYFTVNFINSAGMEISQICSGKLDRLSPPLTSLTLIDDTHSYYTLKLVDVVLIKELNIDLEYEKYHQNQERLELEKEITKTGKTKYYFKKSIEFIKHKIALVYFSIKYIGRPKSNPNIIYNDLELLQKTTMGSIYSKKQIDTSITLSEFTKDELMKLQ